MYITNRKKSNELIYLETLSKRAALTEKEDKTLRRLKKGFEGEQLYDRIFDEVGHEDIQIFRDIWLQADKSITQIDSLIVTDELVLINEIKNYSGNYKYENSAWKIGNLQISDDPLIQAKRAASKLIKIFLENKIDVKVDFNIICPNPYFILSTTDQQCQSKVIRRDVLKQYMRNIRQHQSWDRSARITQALQDKLIPEPAYDVTTDAARITFGRQCSKCWSFNLKSYRYFTICNDCNHKDSNKNHIQSAINDFHILFPNENIRSRDIKNFINNEVSNSTIKRYMSEFCLLNNKGRHATYSFVQNR